MTEPLDETDTESAPAPLDEPSPDVTQADPATANGAQPWGEVPPEDSGTGWVTPKSSDGGGGLARGCVITLLIVAVVVLGGLVGLIFLGSQASTSLEGTVELGTGGTSCSVTGTATTFPVTAAFHLVAHLTRDVPVGETVTSTITFPDGTTESLDQNFDVVVQCITEDVQPGLEPGHYVLEYRSGTEVLAKGGFDITP